MNAASPGPPVALLLDADGVIQRTERLPQVVHLVRDVATWAELDALERQAMTGAQDFHVLLDAFLAERGLHGSRSAITAAWYGIEHDLEALELARRVRARGVPVYLATNQQRHRGELMKRRLRELGVFDGLFFSYELGVSKPDPSYFTRIVDMLGLDASRVLFVDDTLVNVEGARRAGLRAAHLAAAGDVTALREILLEAGLLAGGQSAV